MYDFIAIGDIVIDAFIRLKDAKTNHDHSILTLAFGEKIPYESVDIVPAVGNSANAAVSTARLGLKSALVASLGDDDNGKLCLERLNEERVSTEYASVHEGSKTNYHYVLWYESDRTILVKHEEYKRHLPDIGKPKWLYLSSLGSDSLEYHREVSEYVKNNPEVNLAFQPGTFQIELGTGALKEIYQNSKIFFCNIEEAEKILGVSSLKTEELLEKMHALGPKTVVITDGPKGLYAYDGEIKFYIPAYPDPKPPYERTGAGDALASTTVSTMALGKPLEVALLWGLVNSMSVVQEVGAQKGLLTRSQIEEYLTKAPADFKLKKI